MRIDYGLLGYDTSAMSLGNTVRNLKGQLAKRRLPLNLNPIHSGTNNKITGDFRSSAADHFNVHTNDDDFMLYIDCLSHLELRVFMYVIETVRLFRTFIDMMNFQ